MDPYTYEPLSTPDSIRVIALEPSLDRNATLHCKIIHVDREKVVRGDSQLSHYEPVSYVWGKEPVFSHSLICGSGQKCLAITPNVDEILRTLRKPTKARYLWIDAICLNQMDLEEKSNQVPLMADIFAQGRKTHVYMSFSKPMQGALNMLHRIAQYESTDRALSSNLDQQRRDLEDVVYLLCNPWFGRRWTLQEVALGRRPAIRCIDGSITWSDFAKAANLVQNWLPNVDDISDALVTAALRTLRGISQRRLCFGYSLIDFHHNECSDPSDRLYSLYGLVRRRNPGFCSPPVDYSLDYVEVYMQMAVHMGGPLVLQHLLVFGSLYCGDRTLPSWIPRWSSHALPSIHPQHLSMKTSDMSSDRKMHLSKWRTDLFAMVRDVTGPFAPAKTLADVKRGLQELLQSLAIHEHFPMASEVSRTKHADPDLDVSFARLSSILIDHGENTAEEWIIELIAIVAGLYTRDRIQILPEPGPFSSKSEAGKEPGSQCPRSHDKVVAGWNRIMRYSAVCKYELLHNHTELLPNFGFCLVPACTSEGDVLGIPLVAKHRTFVLRSVELPPDLDTSTLAPAQFFDNTGVAISFAQGSDEYFRLLGFGHEMRFKRRESYAKTTDIIMI